MPSLPRSCQNKRFFFWILVSFWICDLIFWNIPSSLGSALQLPGTAVNAFLPNQSSPLHASLKENSAQVVQSNDTNFHGCKNKTCLSQRIPLVWEVKVKLIPFGISGTVLQAVLALKPTVVPWTTSCRHFVAQFLADINALVVVRTLRILTTACICV